MRKSNLKLLSLGIFIVLMQNSLAADKNRNTDLGWFNSTIGKNNSIIGTLNKTKGDSNTIAGVKQNTIGNNNK